MNQCPADHVQSVELGSSSGPRLQQSEAPGYFETLLAPLVAALMGQTEAINRLAQSNEMLVQAMAEDAGVNEDGPVSHYLDGSPVR